MRILIRISKWAIWARRLGSFALPLALIPVLMHRGAMIPTATFGVIEVVAVGVALLGLIASIGAFVRIWVTGDRGWGRAAAGCGLSLLCLAPPALLAVDYALYPMSSEVSTDLVAPPPLLSPVQPSPPTAEIAARIALAFPNVKSRNYPLAPDRVFAVISQLVAERGWEVLRQDAPDGESGAGQINAIAMTLFGFRDEVSVRLNPDADGTSVAMRSVSLTPLHEPGVNGSRVEAFLTALDDKITRLRKDAPAGTEESDDDSLDATPAPLPSPRAARP